MQFEFDPNKSATNIVKHGIAFEAATALWLDRERIEIPARIQDEERFLIIGLIAGKHWSAVITYRGAAVRIISVRRSRRAEIEIYEGT